GGGGGVAGGGGGRAGGGAGRGGRLGPARVTPHRGRQRVAGGNPVPAEAVAHERATVDRADQGLAHPVVVERPALVVGAEERDVQARLRVEREPGAAAQAADGVLAHRRRD